MTISTATPQNQATQLAHLNQFIVFYIPVLFGFGITFLIVAMLLSDPAIGISSIVIMGYGCLMLIAWQRIRRNEIQAPITMICGGFLVAILIIEILQPFLFVTLTLVPLLVVALALPYISGRALLWLTIICWLEIGVIMTISSFYVVGIFGSHIPDWLIPILSITSTCATTAFIMLLLWQFSSRLNATLDQTRQINDALRTALTDVETRAATQAQLLNEIAQQQSTIRELSVPILPINEKTLLLPLIGALDEQRLQFIREITLEKLHRSPTRLLVLDVTGVITLDTHIAHKLLDLGQMARLLGVEVAMVGIRMEVAQILTSFNINMKGFAIYRDLEMAISVALKKPVSNGHESPSKLK